MIVPGASLRCLVRIVSDSSPTLLHFHGNGEVVADYVPGMLERLASTGANVFLAEYRGYGGSSGEPRLGAMLRDVRAVFDAVGVPAHRVIGFGRSVGSIFALQLAQEEPTLGGLILESGIADPRERLAMRVTPDELGVSQQDFEQPFLHRLNHRAKLGAYTGPLLVMHTRDDAVIDVSHGERLARWGGGQAKRLVLFDHGGHNGIFAANSDPYLAEVKAMVDRIRERTR